MRRALETPAAAIQVNTDLPTISDETQLIGPGEAKELLTRNQHNRPVNWNKVEEFAEIMRRGEWQLTPQGIILDNAGNILTGQTRLWAIVYADKAIYMRVSRGTHAESAFVLDRGRPQTARDLSSRRTDRKHSPTEASIARCVCVLRGEAKPSPDDIAAVLVEKEWILKHLIKETAGDKKDKAMLMILGAIAELGSDGESNCVAGSRRMADQLESQLLPYSASLCWGRGASFGMALQKARTIVSKAI
jgi:hypothetical protein